jgi:hypothetical protein
MDLGMVRAMALKMIDRQNIAAPEPGLAGLNTTTQ